MVKKACVTFVATNKFGEKNLTRTGLNNNKKKFEYGTFNKTRHSLT